jgi:ABC-2 type transport system permease protein
MRLDVRFAIRNPKSEIDMRPHPSYIRVFGIFVRNSLVRDMMFPANFVIESISSAAWVLMNVGLYVLIFHYTPFLGSKDDPAATWDKFQFFVFLATSMLINGLVQMFFMPNAEEFSELIRTGNLDFALLKPVDTQFLISLQKVDWSAIANLVIAIVLLGYAVPRLVGFTPTFAAVLLYPLYVVLGTLIMYSVMITLAATSVWLGRNQSLYDFWFYITNFARYPMEIYQGPIGGLLRWSLTYLLPVLVVVNVPARLMAKPLRADYSYLALFAIAATVISFAASRWIFTRALLSYRSASS